MSNSNQKVKVIDNHFQAEKYFLQLHPKVYGLQSENGMKLTKWKEKRDVLMVSTKPSHSATVVDTRKTNKLNQRVIKPQVVLNPNKGRQGSDLSEQRRE